MAYRADIEIAVKGAQQLKRLQDEISATSKLVNGLNNYLENIGSGGVVRSLSNLQKTVSEAAKAFNEAALETDEASIAATKYVAATRQLNAGLERRAALLKQINEQERTARLARSGIRENPQAYGFPIGPGKGSALEEIGGFRTQLAGQSSPVAERLKRILQARREENELQAGLLRLEQKTTAELNKQLEAQESMIRGKQEVQKVIAERAGFLTGKSGTAIQGPLAGPGAMGFPVALPLTKAEQKGLEIAAKKQEILNRMVLTRQQLVGLATNLQRLDTNAVVAIQDANRAQERLNAAKQRELDISKQGALLRGDFSPIDGSPRFPGGKPIKGSPAFKRAQRERRQQQISGVALGAGFPLLFGGGAGSVLGGALGGLVPGPGGFAAQIGLSALGQQLDAFAGTLKGVADSLGNPTAALTALEDAGIKVNDAVKVQVESLMKQGEAYKAQQLIFEELTRALGPDAIQQLNAYDKELEKLEEEYRKIANAILKELLPALTGFLSFINDFIGLAKSISEDPVFKFLLKTRDFVPAFAAGKALFGAAAGRGKELAAQQPATRDLDAETKAEMAELRRKELLKEIEEAHKRELSLIEAKATRQRGLVDITVRRMDMERSIASAANDAFLKVNDLEMQRAKNAGDTEKQYRLQLQRAQLIYKQTVLQVQQEQRKAKLAVISSQIKLKELEATVAQKAAKGEALAQDYASIELQKQAVQLAYEGVSAAQQIAQYNLMGANAVRKMAIEQAKFNKNKAAGEAIGGGAGVRVYGPSGTRAIGAGDPNAYLSSRLAQLGVTSGTYQQQAAATLVNNLVAQKREQLRAEYRQSTNQRTSIGESRYLAERGYADGGFVTRPTNAMVGEGGQPEYVIPASKMNDAMRRYSAGTRGEAVVTGTGASGGMSSTTNYSNQQNAYYGSGGGTSVNITTGPVMRLGNRNYVTVTDMQRGMAAAVGAAEANMMSRMSRSYAARRSMGL